MPDTDQNSPAKENISGPTFASHPAHRTTYNTGPPNTPNGTSYLLNFLPPTSLTLWTAFFPRGFPVHIIVHLHRPLVSSSSLLCLLIFNPFAYPPSKVAYLPREIVPAGTPIHPFSITPRTRGHAIPFATISRTSKEVVLKTATMITTIRQPSYFRYSQAHASPFHQPPYNKDQVKKGHTVDGPKSAKN